MTKTKGLNSWAVITSNGVLIMPEGYDSRPIRSLDEVRYELTRQTAQERPLKRTPNSRYSRMIPVPLAVYLLAQMGCDSPTRVEVREDKPGELSIRIDDKDGISSASMDIGKKLAVPLLEYGKPQLTIDFAGFNGVASGNRRTNPTSLSATLGYGGQGNRFPHSQADLTVVDRQGNLSRKPIKFRLARNNP